MSHLKISIKYDILPNLAGVPFTVIEVTFFSSSWNSCDKCKRLKNSYTGAPGWPTQQRKQLPILRSWTQAPHWAQSSQKKKKSYTRVIFLGHKFKLLLHKRLSPVRQNALQVSPELHLLHNSSKTKEFFRF